VTLALDVGPERRRRSVASDTNKGGLPLYIPRRGPLRPRFTDYCFFARFLAGVRFTPAIASSTAHTDAVSSLAWPEAIAAV